MCSPYCCSSYAPFFAQDTPIRPPIIYRTSSILLCSPLNYCYYHHHQLRKQHTTTKISAPFPPFFMCTPILYKLIIPYEPSPHTSTLYI